MASKMPKNIVGERIREARLNAKMTQVQLHAQIELRGVDIDYTAISKIENRTLLMNDIVLAAVVDALEVDPRWLLQSDEKKSNEPEL